MKNINTITNILRKNNYPLEEICKFIRKYHFINNKRQEGVTLENTENQEENIYQSITYVEGLTEGLTKK